MDGPIETNEFSFRTSLERSNEKENRSRFPFGSISRLVINLQTFEYLWWNSKNAIGSVPATSPDPPTNRFLRIDPCDMLEDRTVKYFFALQYISFPKGYKLYCFVFQHGVCRRGLYCCISLCARLWQDWALVQFQTVLLAQTYSVSSQKSFSVSYVI